MQAEIARMRSLLAKATPGPWAVTVGGMVKQCGGGVVFMRNDLRGPLADCNAELVAAAINALPALLALAEAVEASPQAYVNRVYDCELGRDGGEITATLPASLVGKRIRLVTLPDGGEVGE